MDDDLLEAIQDVEIRSGAAACVLLSGAAATVGDRRALCSFTVVDNVVQWCFRGRGIYIFCPPESQKTKTRLHVDVVLPVILEDGGEF